MVYVSVMANKLNTLVVSMTQLYNNFVIKCVLLCDLLLLSHERIRRLVGLPVSVSVPFWYWITYTNNKAFWNILIKSSAFLYFFAKGVILINIWTSGHGIEELFPRTPLEFEGTSFGTTLFLVNFRKFYRKWTGNDDYHQFPSSI